MSALNTLASIAAAWAIAGAATAAPAGWEFHAGQPGKPAVLLIHGLAASSKHWTNPAATWSIKNGHFDHREKVHTRSGKKKGVTTVGVTAYPVLVGLESIRVSPVDDDAGKAGSFWAYLVKQGYTVATWDQIPCMDTASPPGAACRDQDLFEPAVKSAQEALAELARLTGNAPIALVGHSRGGLVARRLLKDPAQPGRDRVRWLVTLHSPHQGSSMATAGVAMQRRLEKLGEVAEFDWLPSPVRPALKSLLDAVGGVLDGAVDAVVAITGLKGARELADNGEVLAALRRGEGKPAGVRVVTFGGTSPRVALVHGYLYDARSALPGEEEWSAVPHRVLDFPADLNVAFPEMKPGGDLLVTDAASRLPWADQHVSHALNHAEVLWSRTVQRQVDRVLAGAAP
jgi:pimeloyl-ACP methyl ester carboxylesterase